MNPRIKHVVPQKDFSLKITFENGEIRQFDMTPYLDKGIFKILKDWKYFAQASVKLGTVVWPNELDIAPETLYLESELGIRGRLGVKS